MKKGFKMTISVIIILIAILVLLGLIPLLFEETLDLGVIPKTILTTMLIVILFFIIGRFHRWIEGGKTKIRNSDTCLDVGTSGVFSVQQWIKIG